MNFSVPPTLPSIPIPPSIEPSTIPEEPVNNENNEPELNNGSKSPAKKKTEDKNLASMLETEYTYSLLQLTYHLFR